MDGAEQGVQGTDWKVPVLVADCVCVCVCVIESVLCVCVCEKIFLVEYKLLDQFCFC